ncbi:hypothetical protein BXU06_02480 [Aquaspirillum sp. LM1]|uniref:JmjC domain-containing protein n=1 Tax=Aquaspirillum sp. LM1 TaxID=1938604 RepID=UPI000983A7E5|nr:cupin domain-containing protein [Aquaspirillum sp. LM1]AQR64053.1 hypothetical protein BXU06_02480 [Aquaspirillum sp. LM1]
MIFGMSRADFIGNYFEKRLFICKNEFTDHGIEWKHINETLFSWDPSDGLLHLYKDGLVPQNKYTEFFVDIGLQRSRIVKDAFNAYLHNGATLVLNRLDIKLPLIQKLTMSISRFVGEKAAANGYIAFGGEGTFAKHWDTHDVFAVQLIGRKRWKIFEPTFPLPLPHQKSKEYKHECPVNPIFDGILETGDVLYIPRGWWHEAIPLEGEETFHIAVGIHTAHIADYIAWSCGNTLARLLDFRKTLKFEEDGLQEIREALKNIHEELLNPENICAFKKVQVEQERVTSPFAIEHSSRGSLPILRPEDILSINSAYRAEPRSDRLIVNGFTIKIDEISAKIIENWILEGSVSIKQIIEKAGPVHQSKVQALAEGLLTHDILSIE